jgi:hypothetical protein
VEQANDRELDLIPPFRGCWRGQSSIISGLSDLDSLTFLFHIIFLSAQFFIFDALDVGMQKKIVVVA